MRPAGAGYFIFKTIDSKVDQQGSTLVIAPVVLMLFVADMDDASPHATLPYMSVIRRLIEPF